VPSTRWIASIAVVFGISRALPIPDQTNRHSLQEAPRTIYLDDLIAVIQLVTED